MTSLDRRTLLAAAGSAALGAAARPVPSAPRGQDDQPGRTPHTRFAVNVEMWFGRLPFLDRIRAAAELGFPGVEFWPWRGKDLDAIDALRQELGIEVGQFTAWGFNPGMNDPANHDAFVAEIEASCEVANRLGASCMTVVAGNDQPGMTTEQMHEHVITALRRAAPIAEAADVTLILEPMNGRVDHPGHCLYGSADSIAICKAVDSTHVKINWDLYHMQISEGDLCGHLREGYPWIGYVQLADHPGRREPGTGEIHYPRVLRELHELGYRGLVGLECSPLEDELTAAERVHAADTW
jgi:hydroxypyruvate isomerase